MYVVDMIAIRYFTGKENRIKIGVEYVIMLFFIIFSVTLIYTFVTYLINYNVFKIPEWIKLCGLIVPIGTAALSTCTVWKKKWLFPKKSIL